MRKKAYMGKILVCFGLVVFIIIGCDKNDDGNIPDQEKPIVEVLSIEEVNGKTINFGQSHQLPSNIKIKLSNSTEKIVPVEWNGHFNPLVSGKYNLEGEIYTNHLSLSIENNIIPVNIKVNSCNDSSFVKGFSNQYFLRGYNSSNNVLRWSAINSDSSLACEKNINEYEYSFRIIESEEERQEYLRDNLSVIFNGPVSGVLCNSAVESNEIYLVVCFIYRHKKYDVVEKPYLIEDALNDYNENYEQFKNQYGDKYISSITLARYAGICYSLSTLGLDSIELRKKVNTLSQQLDLKSNELLDLSDLSPLIEMLCTNDIPIGFSNSLLTRTMKDNFEWFKNTVQNSKIEGYEALYIELKDYDIN